MMAYNKFWVALIMAAVTYAQSKFGFTLGIDEASATGIVSTIGALLVYAVPNKA